LLFPTYNDNYSRMTSISIGILLSIGSCLFFLNDSATTIGLFIGIAVGILLILNGILDLPKGQIKFEKQHLFITGLEQNVDIRSLKLVEIRKDSIVLTNVYNEAKVLSNFNINPTIAQTISDYIRAYNTNLDTQVVTNI